MERRGFSKHAALALALCASGGSWVVACGGSPDMRGAGVGGAPGTGGTTPGHGHAATSATSTSGGAVGGGMIGSGGNEAGNTEGTGGGAGAGDAGGNDGGGDAGCSPPTVDAQPPGPPVCGDGYRDQGTEECDDGAGNGLGACGATCVVTDTVVATQMPDAGNAPSELTLGGQPHPVASSAWGFAAGWALGSSPPAELDVAFADALGRPVATHVVSTASTLYPSGAGVALASVGCGKYAAAWTDYGDDGDGAGVALRLLDPTAPVAGAPGHANEGTAFDQVLQDMIWTGSEIAVAWADDGDLSSMGELKVRTFDASLAPTSTDQILAHTSGLSTSAVLAAFGGSWAAAWLSYDTGTVSILAQAGTASWTAGTLGDGAVVDPPALVDLDATHLLVVYASAASAMDSTTLQGAILDVAAPGDAVPFAIPPAVAPSGAQLRHPSLARVGSRLFLTWLSSTSPPGADALPGDVWLKEMDLGATPGTIDTSQPEIPLPRAPADASGAQDSPTLALALPGAPEMLVTAWRDQSGPGLASRVLLEAIPVPIVRKAGP